ncbi:MAG TPA: hypothetical protein VH277_16705 [Gemmatimonadaceae bacterium]|nr:hypothetical protein [Gemmatimonadaceae bacterium]
MPLPPSNPPYALAPNLFRFPALASLAGRAALGGNREVALAVYLAARLAHDALPERCLNPAVRAARTAGAKTWLSNLTLPASVRPALTRLLEASAVSGEAAGQALRSVSIVTANFLDQNARLELDRLAAILDAQTLVG